MAIPSDSPPRLLRRVVPLAAALGAVLAFATCADEPPTAPAVPDNGLASVATGPVPVTVSLTTPGGAAVGAGFRVTIRDQRFEPLVKATDEHGVATFEVRSDLRFCVYASPVFNEGERSNPSGKVFAASDPVPEAGSFAAAIMRDLRQSVAANRSTFNSHCLQSPTHDAGAGNPRNRDIVLPLVGAAHIAGNIRDLAGAATSGPTLLSQSLSGLTLPPAWTKDLEGLPHAHTEIVLGLAWGNFGNGKQLPVAPGLTGLVLSTELLQGSPQKWGQAKGVNAPSQAGQTGSQAIDTEANFCTFRDLEHIDDPIDSSMVHYDVAEGVRHGWQATGFQPSSTFALSYVRVGAGGTTTKIRSPEGSLQVAESCTVGADGAMTCVKGSRSGSFAGPTDFIYNDLGDGRVRVYWFFGFAPTTGWVEWQLEAEEVSRRFGPNHQVPGTARDEYLRGWARYDKPAECSPLSWENTGRLIF